MRLSETVPSFEDRVLCFDSYFMSAPFLEQLLEEGTLGHAVVMGNRINKTKLQGEKELRSMGRGNCGERVRYNGSLSLVK